MIILTYKTPNKNKNQICKNKMQHFPKNHTPILHIAILREDVKRIGNKRVMGETGSSRR